MVVQGPLRSRHLGPSPIVQIRYVPGMSSFSHASALSNLRVRSGGNENHVKALRSLYSKERRSVESYHTSLRPYIEVQEKLNDSLDRCQDDDEAELIKKQIAKNALFMVQSFRHNEKGHRYGGKDDCCEKYGIIRNKRDQAYSSFANGYTGYSFDDFNVEEARSNPLLASLRSTSLEILETNIRQLDELNRVCLKGRNDMQISV